MRRGRAYPRRADVVIALPQGTHGGHGVHGGDLVAALPPTVLAVVAVGYVLLAVRRGREPRGWSRWRTAGFLTGVALVVAAVTGPVAAFAGTDFRGHMLQHLMIGMLAPLGLVLAAPVTLLLRSLSPVHGRRVGAVLRSRAVHLLTDPWIALLLSVGAMVALYCTPLYRITSTGGLPHHLTHLHFLLSGCLFAWVIAGPDPAPRRPSVPLRLVVLGVAIAVHTALSQLMYAGLLVDVPVPAEQLRGAAEIMYYGGDIAELLLAFALVSTWRPARAAGRAGPGSSPESGPGSSPEAFPAGPASRYGR
ncbi:cytochrome c oxidase assembly protein [Streptosporangium sp. NPDC049046]|uniref:cytochrome c oxidase assembly protein n=1 Tax=Streptosporangium sp. NPDC049046 TaxID=3155031 RepID=UPI003416A9A5